MSTKGRSSTRSQRFSTWHSSLSWSPVAQTSSAARAGVTLIEVLLVLAILVALAGIAAPTFESMISSRRLRNATEKLANDLAEARVEAMKNGQAQVFKATLNGRDYSIDAWLGTYDDIDASAGATVQDATGAVVETEAVAGGGVATSSTSTESEIQELETGVQFASIDTLIDTRNAAAIETETGSVPVAGAAAPVAGGESNPILLYPDGSTTTAQIVLADEKGRRMVVQLRGVTGQISFYPTTSVDPSTLPAIEASTPSGAP
ncbi:pilus assembly FimT family protein [Pirellulaceae bacterium SH467]